MATDGVSRVAVGKGYATIDVAGYSGGVRRRKLMTIRTNDRPTIAATIAPVTYNRLNLGKQYDQYGMQQP
jgi:hypothetical protein